MNLLDPDDRAYADEQEAAAHSDPPAEQPNRETFNLTAAAGMLVAFTDDPNLADYAKRMALDVWAMLVALPNDEALAYARILAAEPRDVLAHRAPF